MLESFPDLLPLHACIALHLILYVYRVEVCIDIYRLFGRVKKEKEKQTDMHTKRHVQTTTTKQSVPAPWATPVLFAEWRTHTLVRLLLPSMKTYIPTFHTCVYAPCKLGVSLYVNTCVFLLFFSFFYFCFCFLHLLLKYSFPILYINTK